MTECPKCKGYGIVGSAVPDILRGRGHIFSSIECPQCHGSGEVEMTNEEWFCTLSTEEKAKFLVMIQMSVMHPVKRGAVDMEKFIEEVAEWLKQPHTNN